MKVVNELDLDQTTSDQFFESLDPDSPVVMVNLLKFHEKAEYPDGRQSDLSGEEAYRIYGMKVAKIIHKMGGRVIYGGAISSIMLGQVEELWDSVGVVEYPNPAAFKAMIDSPEYQDIHIHREAGLKGQLNIATRNGIPSR